MESVLQGLTLETLPKAFIHLFNEVGEIKRLLQQKTTPPLETERWFGLAELCQYHPDKPSKATVYGWVNAGTIPVHKSAKKLRFLKSEIDAWLKQGQKKTNVEAASEASTYLQSKKKRG
jgi:excisionase family DNA binding protein